MSIDNPTTFGECYWGLSVDANKAFADAEETSLAPFAKQLLDMVSDLEGFPPIISSLFGAVGMPGHFALPAIVKDTLSDTAKGGITSGLSPFMRALGYAANRKFPSANIGMDTAIKLAQRRKILPELFNSRALGEGFTEAEARLNYTATMPYPSITDLISWARWATNNTGTKELVWSKFDVMEDEWAIWEYLSQQSLSQGDIQSLYVRKEIDRGEAITRLDRAGWRSDDINSLLSLAYNIPAPTVIVQSALLSDRQWESIVEDISLCGIHPDYANDYLHAVLNKPNPGDMIRYMLRTDPNLTDSDRQLKRLGIHPDYLDVWKTLAFPVPPLGDIVTMAVRGAFSSEYADRFGQYDGYPDSLTRYASMNGVTEEWAKRYWAAHWSLPSPQQGFDMLHRGIISFDDLGLLLRAQNIMPFWADKLLQAAYRPLGKMDIKRMYALGLLSEPDVYQAYRAVGYDDNNARRLADFVSRDTVRAQSGMTVGKIVGAYKKGYSTRADANNAILSLGIASQNVSSILESADRQLGWQRVQDAISVIANQYRHEYIDSTEAKQRLAELHLDTVKIDSLLDRWEKDKATAQAELLSKSDVLRMLKRGIIERNRAIAELGLIGFDNERIALLLSDAGYVKPK